MRHGTLLFLLSLCGGCGLNTGPNGELFWVKLTNVKIAPATVHVGLPFVASASVDYGGCSSPAISVMYAGQSAAGMPVAGSFTAVAGENVVSFVASCTIPSGSGGVVAVVTDHQNGFIQVVGA